MVRVRYRSYCQHTKYIPYFAITTELWILENDGSIYSKVPMYSTWEKFYCRDKMVVRASKKSLYLERWSLFWNRALKDSIFQPMAISCQVITSIWISCKQINSLLPSDDIWCQWSWSTLVQVMACCLMTTSHYLNQCWLESTSVQFHRNLAS